MRSGAVVRPVVPLCVPAGLVEPGGVNGTSVVESSRFSPLPLVPVTEPCATVAIVNWL